LMLDAENVRQTLRRWSVDEKLMDLLSQNWRVEFPRENLVAALFHLKGVYIEPIGRSLRLTIWHPHEPLELLVPKAAFQSVLGFQDWLFRLDPGHLVGSAPAPARTADAAWMEYS